MDEFELLLRSSRTEIGCVTESWIHENIPDESPNIEAEICLNVKGWLYVYSLQVRRRADLKRWVCVWIQLHPEWLMRRNCNRKPLTISLTPSTLKLKSPEAGVVLCGDFNHLPTKALIPPRSKTGWQKQDLWRLHDWSDDKTKLKKARNSVQRLIWGTKKPLDDKM